LPTGTRTDGLPAGRGLRGFRPCHVCSGRRPPSLFGVGFILPRACLLSRARRRAACLRSPRAIGRQLWAPEAPPMGFGRALFATSTGRSHLPQEATPLPATVRPRRFSRPRRFAPRPVLRVCFTPQPRTGFPSLRGLSLAAEPCRVSPTAAPVPLRPEPLRLPAPRPETPASGPCSPRRVGGSGQRFRPTGTPCPSRTSPPPGVPSPRHGSFRRLRPRPSPQRTRCGWPSASRWRGARLAWNQATDPPEVSGLNSEGPRDPSARGRPV